MINLSLDRLVILGNHRDAWTFGGADPNSGTAILMEIARVLSTMRENGINYNNTVDIVHYFRMETRKDYCTVQLGC